MGSKKKYAVPAYAMIAEDFVCGDIDFILLDKIIVSRTKTGYEELDGFNNFVVLKSEKGDSRRLNITNYDKCVFINEDDIKKENEVDVFCFHDDGDEKLWCYNQSNQDLKMQYYQKDRFTSFVKVNRGNAKVMRGNG